MRHRSSFCSVETTQEDVGRERVILTEKGRDEEGRAVVEKVYLSCRQGQPRMVLASQLGKAWKKERTERSQSARRG